MAYSTFGVNISPGTVGGSFAPTLMDQLNTQTAAQRTSNALSSMVFGDRSLLTGTMTPVIGRGGVPLPTPTVDPQYTDEALFPVGQGPSPTVMTLAGPGGGSTTLSPTALQSMLSGYGATSVAPAVSPVSFFDTGGTSGDFGGGGGDFGGGGFGDGGGLGIGGGGLGGGGLGSGGGGLGGGVSSGGGGGFSTGGDSSGLSVGAGGIGSDAVASGAAEAAAALGAAHGEAAVANAIGAENNSVAATTAADNIGGIIGGGEIGGPESFGDDGDGSSDGGGFGDGGDGDGGGDGGDGDGGGGDGGIGGDGGGSDGSGADAGGLRYGGHFQVPASPGENPTIADMAGPSVRTFGRAPATLTVDGVQVPIGRMLQMVTEDPNWMDGKALAALQAAGFAVPQRLIATGFGTDRYFDVAAGSGGAADGDSGGVAY